MKIICSGDWHISEKTPENRTDNFEAEGLRKAEYIFEYAVENKIELILQPGDLTDSPFIPYSLFVKLSNLFKTYNDISLITIFGQHDLRYRRKEKTPLYSLKNMADLKIFLIGEKGISYESRNERVNIYGSHFGEEIPEIISKGFNILLIHKMIIQDKLWSAQEDYTTAKKMLRTTDFDLIVSGDNHQTFTETFRGKTLINAGTLMRSKINQLDHKPCFMIYDTNTRDFKIEYIPITSSKIVFKYEQVAKEKERDSQLKEYVSALNQEEDMGVDFVLNLINYVDDNNIDKGISKILIDNLPSTALEGLRE